MSSVITWARKPRLSVLGSAVQPHLCHPPPPFRFQGSKGSQAWTVAVAPRWRAERADSHSSPRPDYPPGTGSCISSIFRKAGGRARRGAQRKRVRIRHGGG